MRREIIYGCLKIVVYVKRDYKRKSVFIYESKIRVSGVAKGQLLVTSRRASFVIGFIPLIL